MLVEIVQIYKKRLLLRWIHNFKVPCDVMQADDIKYNILNAVSEDTDSFSVKMQYLVK